MYTFAVIDDEMYMRRAILSSIDTQALSLTLVGEAGNGEEGLQLLLDKQPQIALVDINMPQKDGLTMIRQAQEAGCGTLFILLTGYDDFAYAQQAVGLPVVDYLLKPVNAGALATALSKAQQRLSRRSEVDMRISSLEQKNNELLLADFFSSMMAGAAVSEETALSLLADLDIDPALFEDCLLVCADCPPVHREGVLNAFQQQSQQQNILVFSTTVGMIYGLGSRRQLEGLEAAVRQAGGRLGVSEPFSGLQAMSRACAQCHAALRKSAPSVNTQVSDAVKTYIEAHLSDPDLSINGIAKATFITYSYLCYCFKRDCGTTINDYITQRRIDTAKQMFLAGARNINRVALEVGYNSNSYFSKSFKKIVGVSPSDFLASIGAQK